MSARLSILVLAPALLVVGVLLMPVSDAWTVSHLVFLTGTLMMLPAGVVLYELLRPARLLWSARVLMFAGALTLAGQFLIDLVVMRLAGGNRTAAGPLFDRVQESTPLALTLYQLGPTLLFTGLALVGVVLIRRQSPLPGWLLVAGTLTEGAGRVADLRAGEVVGLGLVLGALALTASACRSVAPVPAPVSR